MAGRNRPFFGLPCATHTDGQWITPACRCNLRRVYRFGPGCEAPPPGRGRDLGFDEIARLAKVLAQPGVRKFKVTGGEPTLGPDPVGPDLAEAGLDSLDPERYRYLGGSGALSRVIPGLKAAYRSRLPSLKVNRVPQAQTPPGDILADIARGREIRVRLIGPMPMGPGASLPRPIDNDGVPKLPGAHPGPLEPTGLARGNGPASHYRARGFKGLIGLIGAMGSRFRADRNRVRVTHDGYLKTRPHMDRGAPR